MFFKPEMREAILEGRKHVTRRIWKRPHAKVGGIYKVRKGRYSKDFYFNIKVLELFKQRLGDMTEEDAVIEGFRADISNGIVLWSALGKFITYWIMDLHRQWKPDQEVYVITFEVMPE